MTGKVNGKDVTIWTAVETATAIVGSSIPVLRVFIKEKASTLGYDNKNDNDNNNSAQNSDDMELNTYRSAVKSTAVSSPLGAQNAKDAKGGSATDEKKPESGFSLQEIELKRDDGVRARPVDLESQDSDRIETVAKSHHDQFM